MSEAAVFQEHRGQPVCPCCKREFTCGLLAGQAECWCADLPPLPAPTPGEKRCYCPDCLRELSAAQSRPR